MQPDTHQDLLDRIRANDKAALEELFHTYYQFVCNSMVRLIKDRNLIEDLAQEVFLRFWQKRDRIQVSSSLKAYLNRMAINEALAHLRSRKFYAEEVDDERQSLGTDRSVEESYLHGELADHIREAIDRLPPKCRLVFTLSRYEGLSYKEIAGQLDISVKTVENQMGKALKVLREDLKPYLGVLVLLFFN
jgi:RNA polymerase sigma-70 factor (ECF subfamily)